MDPIRSHDEPPLLDEHVDRVSEQIGAKGKSADTEKSVMDEMMAVATEAKAAKRRAVEKEHQFTTGFGAGLKRGFFASTSTRTRQRHVKSQPQRLDASSKSGEKALHILNCAPNQVKQTETDRQTSKLVFPEVQAALKCGHQLKPNDWMNEAFFSKLSKNSRLLLALQNPRFMQAINELQRDPKGAVVKYSRDPDVSQCLREFMELLASHFEELGIEQERQQTREIAPATVDLDEARRQAIANMERTPDEEEQVQKILQSPELLVALSDATLMDQLRQAQQDPLLFRRLVEDPELGEKLQLLIEAKLISLS